MNGGISIVVRNLDSIIRLSEAYAKIQLRDFVNKDDVKRAVKMVLKSFINTQKGSIGRNMQFKFKRYLTINEDTFDEAFTILVKLFKIAEPVDSMKFVEMSKFNAECERMNIQNNTF